MQFPSTDVEDQEPLLGGSTATRTTQPQQPQSHTPHSTYGGVHYPQPEPRFMVVRRDRLSGKILEVDASIDQPDPDKIRLYACINKCASGGVSYWYYEDIPRCYRVIVFLAIVSAIITTPLSLLCFLPMLCCMRKVYYYSESCA